MGQPNDNIFPFWIWFNLYNQINGGGKYLGEKRALFNNSKVLKAINFLIELRDRGFYSQKTNDLQAYNMFKFGKSAIYFTGVWAT